MTVDSALVTDAAESARPSSRGVALVVGVVVGALALAAGVALGRATAPTPPLSAPVFGATDGLPADVVAGRRYTAQLVVALGDDWAQAAEAAGRPDIIALAMVATDRYPQGDILCSGTVVPGAATVLSCPITIDARPGTTLHLEFGVGDVFGTQGAASPSRMYTHTVT